MSQFETIAQIFSKLKIDNIPEFVQQESIISVDSIIIEEIASKLRFSLAGKCYLSIFNEDFLIETFHDVMSDTRIKDPALIFMCRLNQRKQDFTKKDWRKYYLLLEKYKIDTKGRQNYLKDKKYI